MPGRKPLLENELPQVLAVLPEFSARDQALVTLGLNTGFRISELLSLNVADVWDGERVRPQVKVTRSQMKGGRGVRRKGIISRTVPLNEAASGDLAYDFSIAQDRSDSERQDRANLKTRERVGDSLRSLRAGRGRRG